MHSIYRQLCLDHKNMQQLLDAFEALLHDLSRQERDPATLGLILDALDYISVYPDKWHHPVEDLVFEQLLSKPIPNLDTVISTATEHPRIAAATRKLTELFYAIANDHAVERKKLFDAAVDYLTLQRSHMQRENNIVFPLVEQYLTEDDWQAIAGQLRRQQDPMFGTSIKDMYESLHEYLVAYSAPSAALA